MCADWLREKHLAMSEQIVAGCASGGGHGGCDDVKSDSMCESTLAFADSVTDSQALGVGGDVLSCSVTSAACDVRLFSFASPAHVVCSSDTELAVGEHNAAAQVSFVLSGSVQGPILQYARPPWFTHGRTPTVDQHVNCSVNQTRVSPQNSHGLTPTPVQNIPFCVAWHHSPVSGRAHLAPVLRAVMMLAFGRRRHCASVDATTV